MRKIYFETIDEILVTKKKMPSRKGPYYRIEIKADNGEIIRLSSMNYKPKSLVDEKANYLREFLGFEENNLKN